MLLAVSNTCTPCQAQHRQPRGALGKEGTVSSIVLAEPTRHNPRDVSMLFGKKD